MPVRRSPLDRRSFQVLLGACLLLAAPRPQAQNTGRETNPRVTPTVDSTRAVDPLLEDQWHLKARPLEPAGANVRTIWPVRRGDGVVVAVVDDGLQYTHPDLSANYLPSASYDFNFNDSDPMPNPTTNWHGTAVAGIAGARDDNGLGGAGVAPRASIAGIRLIADSTTDEQEANALAYQPDVIAVSSNSWGPPDSGGTLAGPGPLTQAAMESAVLNGRLGRGRIFTWAAGNGGIFDNCNFDGFANSRLVIAIGALSDSGAQASYSESCSALLVSAPSSGGSRGITTTDLIGANGYSTTDFYSNFGGTSAATPLVAGVVALMLEANPNLTWRDVQHVLRQTSYRLNPSDPGWTTGQYPHNEKYGFGQIDAQAAVSTAANWANVPPEAVLSPPGRSVNIPVPDDDPAGITDTITIGDSESNFVIEHIDVTFSATHTWRGDLRVTLTSPSGVVSTLATDRLADSGDDFTNWRFGSKRHWGETAAGIWTLNVTDVLEEEVGTLTGWTLRFFGYRTTSCGYLLSPVSASYGPAAGNGSVNVSTQPGCDWTASSNHGFLAVTSGSSGSTSGVVEYNVAANTGPANAVTAARTGSLTIAGMSFPIMQAGCTFTIVPVATTFGTHGGSGAVDVGAPPGCSWTVTDVPAWATTISGGAGAGPGTWRYAVAASGGVARLQTVSVAGNGFQLRQLGAATTPLVPGRQAPFTLSSSTDQYRRSFEAVAGRSYCILVGADRASARAGPAPLVLSRRADDVTPLGVSDTGRLCFIAPASETVIVSIGQSDSVFRANRFVVVETTLWANWFFTGGNYSSYTLLHNTTPVDAHATLTWRNEAGVVAGTQSLTIPAHGVLFVDARVAAPGAVAGSVEVAHDGEPQDLVGSQTTLSAVTGLSFDTVMMQRKPW